MNDCSIQNDAKSGVLRSFNKDNHNRTKGNDDSIGRSLILVHTTTTNLKCSV